MRARRGLGLSAAAVAWLCFGSGAFAVGTPEPNNNTGFYSAETVALTTGGNQVAINGNNFLYTVLNGPTLFNSPVNFIAPTGNNFTFSSGVVACQRDGVPYAFAAGSGTNMITCPAAGVNFSNVSLINFPALTTPIITLTGPNVAALGNPIQPGGGPLGANPTAVVQINASGPGDPAAGIPDFSIISRNSFSIITAPQTLNVDLTGSGLPTIFPGAGFVVNPPTSGTATVSTAGYLGTFWINVSQNDLDARTGLTLVAGALTGTTTVRLSGDFATITNAYLVPNNAGPPTANMSTACTATQPGNAIGGTTTVNSAKNLITFPALPTPANNAGATNLPVFGVCLVTIGNQVIQAPTAVMISASVAITGASANTPVVGLTGLIGVPPASNTSFGSINYQGSAFFAQNAFGAADGALTFFRAVNRSNTPAQIWAVLTKDVINQVPESGAGSCTVPAGGGTAPITASCNTSFVANLTGASPTATGVITTNLANSAGLVQPNTGTYYTADDIAKLAGTTLPASSLTASVSLLSPNTGVAFSALTQSTVFGVLVQTP